MINSLYKKIFYSFLILISSTIVAFPGRCNELEQKSCLFSFSQLVTELKTGYFFFSDSKMRQIYSSGGLDIQLCASYPVWSLGNKWTLHAYEAIEYFYLSGTSINGHEKTSIGAVPINIGLKPVYAFNADLHYYFTFGPRYCYIHQHNHSHYVYKNQSRHVLGFFLNTGLKYALCNHFVIDIFGEYSYAKMHFHQRDSFIYTRNIQMGGFMLGAGVGYEF